MHWTLAEGINTAAVLYRVTGKQKYADDYAAFMEYLDEKVLDHVNGSWFHQLDRENKVVGTVWPGKADLYHAAQATLDSLLCGGYLHCGGCKRRYDSLGVQAKLTLRRYHCQCFPQRVVFHNTLCREITRQIQQAVFLVSVLLDHLDLQVIEIYLFHKIILIESCAGVFLKFPDGLVQPDRIAKIHFVADFSSAPDTLWVQVSFSSLHITVSLIKWLSFQIFSPQSEHECVLLTFLSYKNNLVSISDPPRQARISAKRIPFSPRHGRKQECGCGSHDELRYAGNHGQSVFPSP